MHQLEGLILAALCIILIWYLARALLIGFVNLISWLIGTGDE